jgi:hypothetical protein
MSQQFRNSVQHLVHSLWDYLLCCYILATQENVTEFTHISNIELNDHDDANGMDENDNFDCKDSNDTVVDESMIPPKLPCTALSFMCFTDAKKKELVLSSGSNIHNKTKQGQQGKTKGEDDDDEDEKIVVVALEDNTRAYWDEEARNDKVRYVF